MANNHDDETSGPVDNLTKDMQKVWEYLMDECFPGYLDQLKQTQVPFTRSTLMGRMTFFYSKLLYYAPKTQTNPISSPIRLH